MPPSQRKAIERYAGGEHRQHNLHVVDGKEVLIAFIGRLSALVKRFNQVHAAATVRA